MLNIELLFIGVLHNKRGNIAKLADRKIVNKQIVQKVKYAELRLA